MTIPSLIAFVGVFFIVVSWTRPGSDRLSPGRIFAFVWLLSIGLADLKLSALQSEWSFYGWIVVLLGPAAFMTGVYAIHVLVLGTSTFSVADIREEFKRIRINERALFRLIIALSLLYAAAYVAEVIIEGGIPFFADRPDRARIEFGVFGIHLIVTALPVILFLIVEYYVFTRAARRRKAILAVLFAVLVLSFFLLLQRFAFVIALLMIIPLVYYGGRLVRARNILLLSSVLLGAFTYIQFFRFAQYVQNYLYVISQMRFPIQYAFFTEPYMYLVMNLENLARAAERLQTHSMGFFTSDALLALTGLKHWTAEYFRLVERPFLVSGYNTFPFTWPYYHDFGLLGVSIVPFILGAAVGSVYHRLRTRPTVSALLVYCIAFFFMAISFFTNPLTALGSVFNFVILLAVNFTLQRKGFLRREESPSRQ